MSIVRVAGMAILVAAFTASCAGETTTAESSSGASPSSVAASASAAPSDNATSGAAPTTVAAMCDILVSDDAPVPPVTPADDDVAGSNEAWTAYFANTYEFWDRVSPALEALVNTEQGDPNSPANDTYAAFLTMKLMMSVNLLSSDVSPASEITESMSGIYEEMAVACPQWTAEDWPYLGMATSAGSADSPSNAPATASADESALTPVTYKKLTAREWALIAKNPDAHVGEAIIVYGYITQFDSATGSDTFRADVSGQRQSDWYDYDTNTFLSGDEARLSDFVEDDIFVAKVTVEGSYSYETTMGGETTVPTLTVVSIKRIGTAD